MNVDERIRSALIAQAKQVTQADLPPSPVPGPDERRLGPPTPRWSGGWLPPLLAAAAVIAVVIGVIAVINVTRSDRARPAHTPAPPPVATSPAPSPAAPTRPATAPSTAPASPQPSGPGQPSNPGQASGSSQPSGPGAPTFDLGYQPLWPFATLADAQAWQASNRSGGHQPWHLDAGQTAIAFTRGFLGFTELGVVTSTKQDASDAHIGVGYRDPNGQPRTAAVLHLVRFGADSDSPWEVVGSDDTSFSLEAPSYGSVVTSPIKVGGHITGVDENIRVSVRQLSSTAPIGGFCCVPAGVGAWGATVPFTGASDPVLTIVASTGGHLQQVERFAIQGVRAG